MSEGHQRETFELHCRSTKMCVYSFTRLYTVGWPFSFAAWSCKSAVPLLLIFCIKSLTLFFCSLYKSNTKANADCGTSCTGNSKCCLNWRAVACNSFAVRLAIVIVGCWYPIDSITDGCLFYQMHGIRFFIYLEPFCGTIIRFSFSDKGINQYSCLYIPVQCIQPIITKCEWRNENSDGCAYHNLDLGPATKHSKRKKKPYSLILA